MPHPSFLQDLARPDLIGPVRRALGDDTAEILGWEVGPLGAGFGNASTLGLARVAGSALVGGAVVHWSVEQRSPWWRRLFGR
jgi:hypothetical protein